MIKQILSREAFIGRYSEKDYLVLFQGALVVPITDYYKSPADAWSDFNMLLHEPELSGVIGSSIFFTLEGNDFIIYSQDDVEGKIKVSDEVLIHQLDVFLLKFLSDDTLTRQEVWAAIFKLRSRKLYEYTRLLGGDFHKDIDQVLGRSLF